MKTIVTPVSPQVYSARIAELAESLAREYDLAEKLAETLLILRDSKARIPASMRQLIDDTLSEHRRIRKLR